MSLNITPDAALAIRELVPDGEGGGLRIFPTPNKDDASRFDIKLRVTGEPNATDEIVAEHGSKVFIEERLSPVLEGKTLDVAEASDQNHVGFRLVS